jgi:hypothetical protein
MAVVCRTDEKQGFSPRMKSEKDSDPVGALISNESVSAWTTPRGEDAQFSHTDNFTRTINNSQSAFPFCHCWNLDEATLEN